jgi:hypothetical protein
LAPVLATGWGASKTYTPQQVEAAVGQAGLGSRHISIAYAAFLTEADYLAVPPTPEHALSHEQALKLLAEAFPGPLAETYHYRAASNSEAITYGLGAP